MRFLTFLLVLILASTAVAADIPRTATFDRFPEWTPQAPQQKTWTAEGKWMTALGTGLAATGIALTATSGQKANAVVYGPGGYIAMQGSSVNNGRRYGGIGLAAAGGCFIAYGLGRRK